MFNVYVPNVQPGVTINYADGSSVEPEGPAQEGEVKQYNADGNSNNNSGSSSSGSDSSTPAPAPKPEPKPETAPAGGDLSSVDTNGKDRVTIKETKGY